MRSRHHRSPHHRFRHHRFEADNTKKWIKIGIYFLIFYIVTSTIYVPINVKKLSYIYHCVNGKVSIVSYFSSYDAIESQIMAWSVGDRYPVIKTRYKCINNIPYKIYETRLWYTILDGDFSWLKLIKYEFDLNNFIHIVNNYLHNFINNKKDEKNNEINTTINSTNFTKNRKKVVIIAG